MNKFHKIGVLKSKFFQIQQCWFSEKEGNHLQIRVRIYRIGNKLRKSRTDYQVESDLNGKLWLISKADLFQRGHLIYSEPSYWSEFSPRTSGFFPFSSLPSSVEVRYFFHLHQGIGNSTPQSIIKIIYWWFIWLFFWVKSFFVTSLLKIIKIIKKLLDVLNTQV